MTTKLALFFVTAVSAGLVACGDDSTSTPMPAEAGLRMEAGAATDEVTTAHDGDDSDAGKIPDAHDIPADASAGAIMCAELGSLCHPYDLGDGELGDRCHDIGHLGEPAACAEVYDECIAFCQQNDAGLDAGSEHAEADPKCEALGQLCHDFDDGMGHECHEIGHDGDAEECAAVYDECVDQCHSDAGSHEHREAGFHDPADAGSHANVDASSHGHLDASSHDPADAGSHAVDAGTGP